MRQKPQYKLYQGCYEHNKPIEELKSKNGLIQKRSFSCRKIQKTDTTVSIVSVAIEWWLRGDSNPRHTGYEPVALTNWATQPSLWWNLRGSNPRPHACKARALPAELKSH